MCLELLQQTAVVFVFNHCKSGGRGVVMLDAKFYSVFGNLLVLSYTTEWQLYLLSLKITLVVFMSMKWILQNHDQDKGVKEHVFFKPINAELMESEHSSQILHHVSLSLVLTNKSGQCILHFFYICIFELFFAKTYKDLIRKWNCRIVHFAYNLLP